MQLYKVINYKSVKGSQILEEADIKPNKITYYCENRDPDFDQKMHNVLLVYKQLSLQFDKKGQLLPFCEDDQVVHVLSYDEKPGIQAIATTSEDIQPDNNHKTISRDYEYRRLGTISLLAGIDLQTGEAIPLVKESHKVRTISNFLKNLITSIQNQIRFVWCWITLKFILLRKPENTSQPYQEDLNLYLLQSTVHG